MSGMFSDRSLDALWRYVDRRSQCLGSEDISRRENNKQLKAKEK